MPQNYGLGLMIFLLYLGTLIAIRGTAASVKEHIRRENAKLFKVLIQMKYLDHPYSAPEKEGIYRDECKSHGFDEVQ